MKERIQAAAVVAFLLLIAGIVYVLLNRVDTEAPPAASPKGDPGADIESASGDPVGGVSILAGKGDFVVRVTAGSCREAGGPKLELSENKSRTFKRIKLPQVDDGSGVSASSPTVRAIAWAKATSPLEMTVAAADTSCTVRPYTTADRGLTWKMESGPVEEWYKDPKTEGVVAPTGPVDVGCDGIVSIAATSKKTAKVFCADGGIRGTIDGGAAWIDVGALPNTSVAVFTGTLTGYASVEGPACSSRIHATVDGGLTWVPRGCVHEEFVLPGLSGTDKRLVAGGTDGMRLSSDGGTTWKPPTKK